MIYCALTLEYTKVLKYMYFSHARRRRRSNQSLAPTPSILPSILPSNHRKLMRRQNRGQNRGQRPRRPNPSPLSPPRRRALRNRIRRKRLIEHLKFLPGNPCHLLQSPSRLTKRPRRPPHPPLPRSSPRTLLRRSYSIPRSWLAQRTTCRQRTTRRQSLRP
jgi:hypothetical protein